jgi:hypothetical protein
MKFDPDKIDFNTKVIDPSGLNLAEFQRIIREIYTTGLDLDEQYNKKITKTVEEPRSRYMVHINYIWRKDPDGDITLNIKYVKKMRSKKKVTKWGKIL